MRMVGLFATCEGLQGDGGAVAGQQTEGQVLQSHIKSFLDGQIAEPGVFSDCSA